jgi:hypothetical protein
MRPNDLEYRKARASSFQRAFGWFLVAVFCGSLASAQTEARTNSERTARFLDGRSRGAGYDAARPAAEALDRARRQHLAMLARPETSSLSARWSPVGPAQVASQSFGNVTGRVTSIALDPADPSGNTVYVGTTGGGVWKSTNAAGVASSVTFTALTDTLPVFSANSGSSATASLSIGALAISPTGVLLAGTGDPNDATDSYYGAGLLRSADGGQTWTLIEESHDGVAGNHSFFGLSCAGLAFSSANPLLAVAAMADSTEGDAVNAPDATYAVPGLYSSSDGGVTWQLATIMDGSQIVQGPGFSANGATPAATAVVWNPLRQVFVAAVRSHGYYQSSDGATWTRLANQPGAGLTAAACPANPGSSACPIFRGALAIQPATGDLFALTVDGNNLDQGLFQDVCAATGGHCASGSVQFAKTLNAAPLEAGAGNREIAQGDYNLTLAAVADGADTLLFAGTVDLYRCSLAAGCALRNTTNAQNGCLTPAKVFPAQHALAALATTGPPLLFVGNDGGVYRSTDGVNQQAAACSADDVNHFQNLNGGLGSLAQIVSFAQDPVQPATLLAGLGALGSAGTAVSSAPWPQLATGEGGTVAIDQTSPANWYLATGAGVNLAFCAHGAACTPSQFRTSLAPAQVGGESALVHAPWLLDPALQSNLLLGTCRAWRGPADTAAQWTSSNALSPPFAAPAASGCGSALPLVRSLAAAGPLSSGTGAQNHGSATLYAGLEGAYATGLPLGGHLFTTSAANLAANTLAWRDAALGIVTNDPLDSGVFNPGGFDISSIAADPHDATGRTVYATILGFAANGVNTPHVYGSTDAGLHWQNLSANLPNAPANSVLVDPNDANTVYIALDTGVYVTTQVTTCPSANCWSVYGAGLPNAPVIQLSASAAMATGDGRLGELRAGTYGRGIWTIPLLNAVSPAAPAMAINPTSAGFGAAAVGTATAAQTFTVTNTGNATLTISAVTTSGDFTETDTCAQASLAQGATCTVSVAFLPTATGLRAGQLTVFGNVPGGQATALLSGTGTAPAAIVLTPAALSFPATTVGAISSAQSLTVANTGGTAATIQSPAITGDFQVSAGTCVAGTLAAGTSCTVSIVFAPTASGARGGSLTVGSSLGAQVAALSGTGIAPPTDTLSAASLSFSATQVGTTSSTQQVTLTNAGDAALTLIQARTTGDFAAVNGCGTSLAGHSGCTFSVTYSPHTAGTESGTLTVTDALRSQTVQLSGIGLAPPGVSLLPSTGLAFGAIAVGSTSAAQKITLTNNGGVVLNVSSIGASGDFALTTGGNTCGQTLAPAAQCTVAVAFAPTAAGARGGTFTVADNAANSPQTLPLTGTGVDFTLAPDGPVSASIRSGQTATYLLLLSSAAGVPGSAQLTCAGVPVNAICTVSPANPALGGTTVLTVTIATGVSTVDLALPPRPGSRPTLPIIFAICAAFLWLLPGKYRRRPRLLSLFALAGLTAAIGCSVTRTIPTSGTGPTPLVTPSGTYNLVVAASSAGLVRSVDLTLMVQ